MAIDTIEEAYGDYCKRMPSVAPEARRIAQAGGVHQIVITTRHTGKRGIVTEMEERELVVGRTHGRFIDLK